MSTWSINLDKSSGYDFLENVRHQLSVSEDRQALGADTCQSSLMYLMRIGPAGSERPVVRIDDTHYLDVSDVVGDSMNGSSEARD